MRLIAALIAVAAACSLHAASSTISPGHADSWAANVGWLSWGDSSSGVIVTASYCAGSIYAENVGWINVGKVPVQGIAYRNSGSDFGINIDSLGNLQGYAYSANVGWISFTPQGTPRVDLHTGKFSGYAYGANIGWIALGNSTTFVQTVPAPDTVDLDHDGIADAWEIQYTGSLDVYTATTDSDLDGVSDLEEFIAGTDPTDPTDFLKIIRTSIDSGQVSLTWRSSPDRLYSIESRADFSTNSNWQGITIVSGSNSTNTTTLLPITTDTQFFRVQTEHP